MLCTCMVLIPAWAAVRLSNERSDTNVDLLFVSTLRPTSIIGGKFFSALVLAMLVFSCCAPFLTFAYLLRGIDIPSIMLVMGMDILAMLLSTQVGLFLAAIPTSRAFKLFIFLGAAILLIWCYGGMVAGTYEVLHRGVSDIRRSEFWLMVGVTTLTTLFATGLLFFWSVALISPPSANRALMSRLFLVASWIVLGAVCLGMSAYFPDADNIPLYFWMVGSVALFGVQFLISINERDSWGSRVARTIPRNRLLRFFAFLFYSGAAGGVSLAVLCVVLTLCAGLYWQMLFPARHFGEGSEIILSVSAALGLYVFCYSMTAVLLRVYVLRDRLRVLYNWVLAFLLLAVGSTLPWITVLFFDFDRFGRSAEIQWWMLPNPFDALYKIGPGHDYYAPEVSPWPVSCSWVSGPCR